MAPLFSIRCLFFSLLCALLLMSGCASDPPVTPAPPVAPVDVYLIPMDDFSFREASWLASSLSRDTGLRIKATLNMLSDGLKPFPGTKQYAGEDIIEAAQPVRKNLPHTGLETAFVVLTQRDINLRDRKLRFTFAVHRKSERTGVLSSARLALGKDQPMAPVQTIRQRIKKMTKRQIGDVYYGYTRSTDISDIMYAPIMGLDDVDRLGWKFPNR